MGNKSRSASSNKPKGSKAGFTTKDSIPWPIRFLALLLRVGKDNPAVLWAYLTGSVRYLLVKFGVLSGAAKHVASVSAEFEAQSAHAEFEERWFDGNIVPWCLMFPRVFDRADPVRILEIGSWEGRSTLFLLTYFGRGHLTAVDTWAGSDEYHHSSRDLEARFDGNVAPCVTRLTKRKGSSLDVLPRLLDEQQKFDLIYVDGSHLADDVLTDGITAWRMLNLGGVMIFDDFLWPCYTRARANPWWAINMFLKYHKGEFNVLNAEYQLVLQKKIEFADRVIISPLTSSLQFEDGHRGNGLTAKP